MGYPSKHFPQILVLHGSIGTPDVGLSSAESMPAGIACWKLCGRKIPTMLLDSPNQVRVKGMVILREVVRQTRYTSPDLG